MMSDQDEDEAVRQLFDHTDRLLKGHQKLLSDERRNKLIYSALRKTISEESSVLDIGSGTGIWAVAAAKLGAQRVVAVEYEPLLIDIIKELAKENGVAGKVEVILGDSRQIHLEREFDVVISETVGHMVFDESIVPIMVDARTRFLRPRGRLIPQKVSLIAAAGSLQSGIEHLPAGIPISGFAFERLALNIPVGLEEKASIEILTEPKTLVSADLRTASDSPDLMNLIAEWDLPENAEINCFAVWAKIDLTDEISIFTNETSSWVPMVFRIKPFNGKTGRVKFELSLTSTSNFWKVQFTNGEFQEEQSYSPALAGTELLKRSRAVSDMFKDFRSS